MKKVKKEKVESEKKSFYRWLISATKSFWYRREEKRLFKNDLNDVNGCNGVADQNTVRELESVIGRF